MKTTLTIIGVLVLIGLIFLVCFYIFFNPQQSFDQISTNDLSPTPNENSSTATSSSQESQQASTTQIVTQAFSEQTSIRDLSLTIGKPAVVLPYALQPWGTTNGGGQALLKYDSAKGWVLLSGGGGEWDVPSLVTMGVPQSIAEQLVSEMQQK